MRLLNYIAFLFVGFAQVLILNLFQKRHNLVIVIGNVIILCASVVNTIVGLENTSKYAVKFLWPMLLLISSTAMFGYVLVTMQRLDN